MAGTKEIKRRIKSVKNTKKITKAMELVSASKMKRAIGSALGSRAYANYSWEVLESLSQYVTNTANPLLLKREEGKTLIIFISSNRGLCGGYNSQITRKVISTLRENTTTEIDFISVGKKGEGSLRRVGQNIVASFNELPDAPKLSDIYPIANLAIDMYKQGVYNKICVAYTDFVSALSQVPHVSTVLPISKKAIDEGIAEAKTTAVRVGTDYTFEPDYETLMSIIVEKIARMRVYQMILESSASEHSARMMAMKNASDAAGEMIDDLTLAFNKARQANITQEISEISAGMASVS
ncbi:MAG: ATP synthase F1 subunit gamma [Candidatus Pacebacteria bacterium]|nr:ATP synthase F1 subunit gamma [Candidatus Paceibacterota bacterium]